MHRSGQEVRVFTRNLNDVTARVPEVVESVLALPARSLIVDGEVLALRPGGRPHAYLLGEARVVLALRQVIEERGLKPDQISPKAYWGRGKANAGHGEPAGGG